MTPKRCRLCISDPITRINKLWKRRDIIKEKIQQLQDQIYLVDSEIATLVKEQP